MNSANTACKLFAFFISSNTSEGEVALGKLRGASIDDVAVEIGDGKYRTRYGNIDFSIDVRQARSFDVRHYAEQERALNERIAEKQRMLDGLQMSLEQARLDVQAYEALFARHAKSVRRAAEMRERAEYRAAQKARNAHNSFGDRNAEKDLDKLGAWFTWVLDGFFE